MSKLPLLLSVPHAGLQVPDEVRSHNVLSPQQVAEDGDEQAREIYALEPDVREYVTTEIARAFVDLNRAEDDRRKDGVVKTHTCWDVPVYDPDPPEDVLRGLIDTYWRPYHARLTEAGKARGVLLGVDGHTMAAHGPPVGPDPGSERPAVCLGNADGTCPDEWLRWLGEGFEEAFGLEVALNEPFSGGYITVAHSVEMPWVQIELSRAPFASPGEKRQGVLKALQLLCDRIA